MSASLKFPCRWLGNTYKGEHPGVGARWLLSGACVAVIRTAPQTSWGSPTLRGTPGRCARWMRSHGELLRVRAAACCRDTCTDPRAWIYGHGFEAEVLPPAGGTACDVCVRADVCGCELCCRTLPDTRIREQACVAQD